MVVVGVPPLEFWVLSVFQDVLLTLKVWVVEADPGATLHTDGVHPESAAPPPSKTYSQFSSTSHFLTNKPRPPRHAGPTHSDQLDSHKTVCVCVFMPVHEAPILEVVTLPPDLQLPASETFPFVKGDLEEKRFL